jgi:polysaccharide export outer membrane protein
MNSNFPSGRGVCGASAGGTEAAGAERAEMRAKRSGQRLAGLLLVAVCWAGGAQVAIGQLSSQGGAPSGTQSSSSPAGDAAAQTAAPSSIPLGNQAMLYPSEDFTLSTGDLISIFVFMQSDYSATVRVKLDGTVQLPLIGSVPVQGLTVQRAQNLIAERLRTGGFYSEPEVTIRVLDTVNGTVMVTGEVRAQVPVANERSLRDVLLTAGGLPANANHTVKIVRPGVEEPIVVNLGPDLAASSAANIPVRPHDIIQITRASVVYVLGAFGHQGSFPLDQATPLTLLQLAALSGGLNYEGKYEDLRLIRTVGNERKVVSVDIKKIRDGKADDPILQANDIVFLPTNDMKAVLKSLGIGGVLGLVSLLFAIHNY